MTVDVEVVFHAPTTTIVTVTQPATTTVEVTETEQVLIQETTEGVPGPQGLSAYAVAVLDGFVGTEQDWLTALVGPQGIQGVQGTQGIQGIQGAPGAQGDLSGIYQFSQGLPDTLWTIEHDLGYYPNVTTVDSANSRIEGDISYLDINTLTVTFSVPIGGRAYLS